MYTSCAGVSPSLPKAGAGSRAQSLRQTSSFGSTRYSSLPGSGVVTRDALRAGLARQVGGRNTTNTCNERTILSNSLAPLETRYEAIVSMKKESERPLLCRSRLFAASSYEFFFFLVGREVLTTDLQRPLHPLH